MRFVHVVVLMSSGADVVKPVFRNSSRTKWWCQCVCVSVFFSTQSCHALFCECYFEHAIIKSFIFLRYNSQLLKNMGVSTTDNF